MCGYPVVLKLSGRKCVVVGGGEVAERKVLSLLETEASVTVISPNLCAGLAALVEAGSVEHLKSGYQRGLISGALLVIAATDDPETNKAISVEAQELGILVNVVDNPQLCTFYVPAVLRRGNFTIAVSTLGRSPGLAKHVREQLEARFGPEYGELTNLLGALREDIKARYKNEAERSCAYLRIIESDVLELLAQGKREEAFRRARECIS